MGNENCGEFRVIEELTGQRNKASQEKKNIADRKICPYAARAIPYLNAPSTIQRIITGGNRELLHKTRTADAVLSAARIAGGADQGHSGMVQASAAAGIQDLATHADQRSMV